MTRLIWGVIGILVLVHAYLYIRYKTVDPCEAALAKVATEQPGETARVLQLIGTRDLGSIGQCYLIAIVGAPTGAPSGNPI